MKQFTRKNTGIESIAIEGNKKYLLYTAVKENNVSQLKSLITKNTNLNISNENGETLLHVAAKNKIINNEIFNVLIKHGADLSLTDKNGKRADELQNTNGYLYLLKQKLFEAVKAMQKNPKAADYVKEILEKNPTWLFVKSQDREQKTLLKTILRLGNPLKLLPVINNALKTNDVKIIKLLLKEKVEAAIGQTLLHIAIKNENIEAIKSLLDQRIDLGVKDKNNKLPFEIAIDRGNLDIIQLLQQGSAQNKLKNSAGLTLLHIAVMKKKYEIVQALLQKEIDVNVANKAGYTPFDLVLYNEDTIAASLLLSSNAIKMNATNKEGEAPLHIAVRQKNTDIVRLLLLLYKANVNVRDKDNQTPLHIAVSNKNYEMVALLLNSGANVNAKANSNQTPLHIAIANKDHKTVELLINQDADVNAKTNSNQTPLHYAASIGSLNITNQLLAKNIDVNVKNRLLRTPLYNAISSNNFAIVEMLINNGAKINIEDKYKVKPLDFAKNNLVNFNDREDHKKIIELLEKQEKNNNTKNIDQSISELKDSLDNQDSLKLEAYTYNNKDWFNKSIDDKNVLLYAASQCDKDNKADFFKYIVESYAFDSKQQIFDCLKIKDKKGYTSLHYAVEAGNPDLVAYLLDKGVEINAKTVKGQTPLHITVQAKNAELVNLLLSKKEINVNIKDEKGYTPLHYAVEANDVAMNLIGNGEERPAVKNKNNKINIMQSLLKSGANINAQDNFGSTPLHCAVLLENQNKVCEWLIANGANLSLKDKNNERADQLSVENNYMNKLMDTFFQPIKQKETRVIEAFFQKNQTWLSFDSVKKILPSLYAAGSVSVEQFKGLGKYLNTESIIPIQNKKCLLISKELIQSKDNQGNTLFHIAAANGQFEILKSFKVILNKDLKEILNQKNNQGKTPLDLAKEQPEQCKKAIEYLTVLDAKPAIIAKNSQVGLFKDKKIEDNDNKNNDNQGYNNQEINNTPN